MSAAGEMGEYVAEAFYTYEDMRAQRDEAIEQRDIAREWTVALEQELAELRRRIAAERDDLEESGQRYAASRLSRLLAQT